MRRVKIILADDHPLTLEGIWTILEPFHEIAAAVGDGQSLVETAIRLKPDLVILDINMPHLNGMDAAVRIQKALPAVKLLFVTMHFNPASAEAALAAGASGYLLKTDAKDELLAAVTRVMEGEEYVSPKVAIELLERSSKPDKLAVRLFLTKCEREVLQLVTEGKASKEIAHLLNISHKTVEFHRNSMKDKLGLRTTAELTRHAIEMGLA